MRDLLPERFCAELAVTFGEEAIKLLGSYDQPAFAGLRYNTCKLTTEEIGKKAEGRKQVPWAKAGYYQAEEEAPGKTLDFYKGLIYIQEPSAMTPAEFLDVQPGDHVLDLCAAPGGKSTRLAEKLQGKGVLYANDISASRAAALLRNLERFGAGNLFVTAESPEKLATCFPEAFDKILVDAPCSGEGMFRKDPSLIRSWEEKGPDTYAPLQKNILNTALSMLKPGGYLLYSTCTFSPKEDEEVVADALCNNEDVEEVLLSEHPLFYEGMLPCAHGIKLLPSRIHGEGHFLALLKKKERTSQGVGGETPLDRDETAKLSKTSFERNSTALLDDAISGKRDSAAYLLREKDLWENGRKRGNADRYGSESASRKKPNRPGSAASAGKTPATQTPLAAWQEFASLLRIGIPAENLYEKDGHLYLLPAGCEVSRSLRYLRTGLHLGDLKKNRFEPSQALAMWLKKGDFDQEVELSEEEAFRYLRGETIELPAEDFGDLRGEVRDLPVENPGDLRGETRDLPGDLRREARDLQEASRDPGQEAGAQRMVFSARKMPNKGWCLVLQDGQPLGFAIVQDGRLKNKLDPGWRVL